jgi:hypothetical protein
MTRTARIAAGLVAVGLALPLAAAKKEVVEKKDTYQEAPPGTRPMPPLDYEAWKLGATQGAPPSTRPAAPKSGAVALAAWVDRENDDLLTIIKTLLKHDDSQINAYLKNEAEGTRDGWEQIRLRTQFIQHVIEKTAAGTGGGDH